MSQRCTGVNNYYIYVYSIIIDIDTEYCDVLEYIFQPNTYDPMGYFSFQPVLHNLCCKGCGKY